MNDSLEGKVALVTGAGRGVGQGIVEVLAERGAAVAVNDLHEERAAAVAAALGDTGARSSTAVFDVTDRAAVRAGVAAVEAELGPIDVLVSNAGVPENRYTGPFVASTPEEWKVYVDLNVYGPLNCFHAVLPGMLERGRGRLIQISSGSAARGLPAGVGETIYGGSKAFVDGFLRHLALEVAKTGVTINAVAPGLIDAAAVYASQDVLDRVLANVPIGRYGDAREIGDAVAWLATDAAGYVTGQVIHVNGGSYQGR